MTHSTQRLKNVIPAEAGIHGLTSYQFILVVINTSDQIVGHADVQRAILPTGKNVDIVRFHGASRIDSRLRGNDIVGVRVTSVI